MMKYYDGALPDLFHLLVVGPLHTGCHLLLHRVQEDLV